MNPSEIKWVQVSPSESKWVQVSPSESKWVQAIPSESKWIQVNPSESKWMQVSPSEPKWIQVGSSESPSESKWIQVNPSESKWIHVSPSKSKWVQVNPSESKPGKPAQVSPGESKWIQVNPNETTKWAPSPLPPILLSNFSWLYRYWYRCPSPHLVATGRLISDQSPGTKNLEACCLSACSWNSAGNTTTTIELEGNFLAMLPRSWQCLLHLPTHALELGSANWHQHCLAMCGLWLLLNSYFMLVKVPPPHMHTCPGAYFGIKTAAESSECGFVCVQHFSRLPFINWGDFCPGNHHFENFPKSAEIERWEQFQKPFKTCRKCFGKVPTALLPCMCWCRPGPKDVSRNRFCTFPWTCWFFILNEAL